MKRQSIGDKVVNVIFYIILGFFVILCFYPVWYAFLASFSDPTYINSGKLIILPRGLTFGAYKYALAQRQLWLGYANTILYTVAGTLFGLIVCLPAGYALSRNDLPFRKIIMALFVFTMYFGGGLIPTYIVASTLHLVNTRWILIMFGSVSVYNMILIRTFCGSTIPEELREAASMDGCSNTRFFFTFVLPLSKAIIAVIALYVAVAHCNNYYNALGALQGNYQQENANDQWLAQYEMNKQAQDYENMLTQQKIEQGGYDTLLAKLQYEEYLKKRNAAASGSSRSSRGRSSGSKSKSSSSASSKLTAAPKGKVKNVDVLNALNKLAKVDNGTAPVATTKEDFLDYVTKNYEITHLPETISDKVFNSKKSILNGR